MGLTGKLVRGLGKIQLGLPPLTSLGVTNRTGRLVGFHDWVSTKKISNVLSTLAHHANPRHSSVLDFMRLMEFSRTGLAHLTPTWLRDFLIKNLWLVNLLDIQPTLFTLCCEVVSGSVPFLPVVTPGGLTSFEGFF